jgi:hypothetical protein
MIRGLPLAVTCRQRPVIARLGLPGRVRLGGLGLRPLSPLTRILVRVAAQAFTGTGKSESGRTEFAGSSVTAAAAAIIDHDQGTGSQPPPLRLTRITARPSPSQRHPSGRRPSRPPRQPRAAVPSPYWHWKLEGALLLSQ